MVLMVKIIEIAGCLGSSPNTSVSAYVSHSGPSKRYRGAGHQNKSIGKILSLYYSTIPAEASLINAFRRQNEIISL
jgi:hypothetical protein